MRDLQLIRGTDDKRRLDLAGVGSVRFENLWGTKLVITAPASGEWRIDGRGPFKRASVATDPRRRVGFEGPLLLLLALYAACLIAQTRHAGAATGI